MDMLKEKETKVYKKLLAKRNVVIIQGEENNKHIINHHHSLAEIRKDSTSTKLEQNAV